VVTRRTFGRWPVRLLALAGSGLLAIASFGFWLDSRVLDDDGFADVVAKSSQRQEVRDYIADQATLRLAGTSNFVSGARPLVTNAVSTAIATPPVEDAVREFAHRAHAQVFSVRGQARADIDAQQASTTIRSALQTINPAMAKKLPANVLDASATVSQNDLVDRVLDISGWVWLWIPTGLVGIALLFLAMIKAQDRVRAIRTVGVTVAVAGALLAGFASSTPAVAFAAAPNDAPRGEAIAAFVQTLTGRLSGFGLALLLIGLAVAFAPGKDGGDLQHRWQKYREYWATKWTSPRWRFAGGLALVILAAFFMTRPEQTAGFFLRIAAFIVFYIGVVVCLRATGLLEPDHEIERLRKRQVVGVFAAMAIAVLVTAGAVVGLVSATATTPTANPTNQGCNGFIELCDQPLDQLVWPASHNAMSSAAYNFFGAEHTITVPEQLNAGVRFLMLDVYYGYDDDGLVRTNLAGGVDRQELEDERGRDAVRTLDRLGALTGTVDTSGRKQEIYFCHDFCELGAVRAGEVLDGIAEFLDRNLTDVVMLDLEDYVKAKDMKQALVDADLFDRVLVLDPSELHETTLRDVIVPKDPDADQAERRLIVLSEKHGKEQKWLQPTYATFQETPFTFESIDGFNCKPDRGKKANPLFLINHWLRPDGPPDPQAASKVNSRRVLGERFRKCAARRGLLPNVVAVDFTTIGDLQKSVNRFNAAVATATGTADAIDEIVRERRDSGDLTEAELTELRALRRLPRLEEEDALDLLGPVAASLTHPDLSQQAERAKRSGTANKDNNDG
jgi:hypothetical protein